MKTKIIKWLASNYQRIRISIFIKISNNNYSGQPRIIIPTQFAGKGSIEFGENTQLGITPSPYFYSSIIYLEARNSGAKISFGNNVFVNNGLVIICESSSVTIQDNVLIGTNVEIIDSDFHSINPQERNSGNHKSKPVVICKNVFLGSNVKICKGVTIGENSIVANSAVVFNNIPSNSIVSGNPATFIKKIE
jgi:acetyltransferase-like isoleucine patch superfamily enzyme